MSPRPALLVSRLLLALLGPALSMPVVSIPAVSMPAVVMPAVLVSTVLVSGTAVAAEPFRRLPASQMEALRRWLCPHGGSPARGRPGRCDGAGGGRGGMSGSFDEPGWDRGLAPPRRDATIQCPPGTKAVLARAHNDVIRCLPD